MGHMADRHGKAGGAAPARGPGVMEGTFSTQGLPPRQQFDAWRSRVGPLIDLAPLHDPHAGYMASNRLWHLGAMAYSAVVAPAVGYGRTAASIRRDSIDHWMLLSVRRGSAVFRVDDSVVTARPGVPVIVPMGRSHDGQRSDSEWKALFLPRESFAALSARLDSAPAHSCEPPFGHLIDEFMLWLDHALPAMAAAQVSTLPGVISTLLAACLGPALASGETEGAEPQRRVLDIARRERVRRLIRANLGAHTLGPRMLCRAAGVSRSTLYRLFEPSGGVAAAIQRERLDVAYAALTDPSDARPIRDIAESLAFADASTFSRAFRAAFGCTPRDVRQAASLGHAPVRHRAAATPADPGDLVELLLTL